MERRCGGGGHCRIQVQRLIVLERGSGRVARGRGPAFLLGAELAERSRITIRIK